METSLPKKEQAKDENNEGQSPINKEIQGQIQVQDHVQTVETPAKKVQMTEAELSENLIDQILNNDDLLTLTDDLQDDSSCHRGFAY